MQLYDVFMLAVLALAAVFGAWKGMAWQLASLASLVVSTGAAIHFSRPLAAYISTREPWNRFLAMLIIYLAVSLGIWLLFRWVAELIDRVRLKEFDRQAGALFGAAKGALLCLLITFFAVTLSESVRQSVLRSRSGYYIAWFIQRAGPVLPEELRAVVGEYLEELDRKLDPQSPSVQPTRETAGGSEPIRRPAAHLSWGDPFDVDLAQTTSVAGAASDVARLAPT